MALATVSPITLSGAQTALFVATIEVPMTETTIKGMGGNKTEVQGSTSVSNGVVWKEPVGGDVGWSMSWKAFWRVGTVVTPPLILIHKVYFIQAYVRRPGWNGAGDPGYWYQGNLLIDDNTLVLNPSLGAMEWNVTGSGQGPLAPPT